jgi:hypothetical protein
MYVCLFSASEPFAVMVQASKPNSHQIDDGDEPPSMSKTMHGKMMMKLKCLSQMVV